MATPSSIWACPNKNPYLFADQDMVKIKKMLSGQHRAEFLQAVHKLDSRWQELNLPKRLRGKKRPWPLGGNTPMWRSDLKKERLEAKNAWEGHRRAFLDLTGPQGDMPK